MSPDAGQRGQRPAAHRFVDVPAVTERSGNPSAMYGRLVVAVVVAIVITIGAFAAAVGRFFAGTHEVTPPEYVDIGPFTVLVSTDLPPANLIWTAVFGIIAVAAFAELARVRKPAIDIAVGWA